jgi:glycosyltransferase involved in cell wall biosynthesis
MRIGYVLTDFPPLSETFIRREVLALCAAGESVFVYTHRNDVDPLVSQPTHPGLTVRCLPFLRDLSALVTAARQDGVDHLHGSLMLSAQEATFAAARELGIPFSITAYSGYSVFTAGGPIFRELSASPLCGGVVVEDQFMRGWAIEHLGVDPGKVEVIPNAFDLAEYQPPAAARPTREKPRILSIARFVEKKGLIHLIAAFRKLRAGRAAELFIIGRGPEEERLRRAAEAVPDVRFLGAQPEARCKEAYAEADVFCLPCVRAADGDADGIPTTVLEAMARGLPVVVSNLLSAPSYVRNEQEGLLAEPGDVDGLAACLERLCADLALRRRLGGNARRRVEELCDIQRNAGRLRDLFVRAQSLRPRAARIEPVPQMPLVSVCITTYDRERFIGECIDSVLAQTYRPIEIVVADDGSTDGTDAVLARYGGDVRVRRHERNRGIAAAKNLALRSASELSRYVAILDSDDYFQPEFVERCVRFLEANPDLGLVYANEIIVNEAGGELYRSRDADPWNTERWLRTCHMKADTWLARRDLVLATDLHDERMPMDEDYDLFYQLLERTRFGHLPEPLVTIRRHGGQLTGDRLTLARCHAANLVKYGYSPEYAYLRARHNPEWLPAIEEGIALGKALREERERKSGGEPVREAVG